jgi:hypothetical protein
MGACKSTITNSSVTPCTEVLLNVTEREFYTSFLKSNIVKNSQIILAIDATRSNDMRGQIAGGINLHEIYNVPGKKNVYEEVIESSVTFLKQNENAVVPLIFFGSQEANDNWDYPGIISGGNCIIKNGNINNIINRYRIGISHMVLSGPTNFVPLIDNAVDHVKRTGKYTILLIITDGAVCNIENHKKALIYASNFSLSIVSIGVGNGNFKTMEEFDRMEGRKVNNFHFVRFNEIVKEKSIKNIRSYFFYRAFIEIPFQYKFFQERVQYNNLIINSSRPMSPLPTSLHSEWLIHKMVIPVSSRIMNTKTNFT